jgi:hypothetical protein
MRFICRKKWRERGQELILDERGQELILDI